MAVPGRDICVAVLGRDICVAVPGRDYLSGCSISWVSAILVHSYNMIYSQGTDFRIFLNGYTNSSLLIALNRSTASWALDRLDRLKVKSLLKKKTLPF